MSIWHFWLLILFSADCSTPSKPVEYFMGTEAGEKAKPIIENSEEKITPTICLAEVYAKTLKIENQELAEKQRAFIKEKSAIATLDEPIAVESAKVLTEMKKEIDGWGMANSIVYATALLKKAEVVTEMNTSKN